MLPLMFSSGAGANGNSSLGTTVVGGMLVGTIALLFVVPVFFVIFEYLQEKIRPPKHEEADVQFVDEAHYYKNLAAYSKMRNVGGISQTEAQKSSDLYMKCRYLDEITGGRASPCKPHCRITYPNRVLQ